MQLEELKEMEALVAAFSILGRIGGDATFHGGEVYAVPLKLSVSSVGSEAMQRWEAGTIPPSYTTFQYPRSDRRRCNETNATDPEVPQSEAFSILGRIGGDATMGVVRYRILVLLPFSILGRIGGDATT